MSKYYPSDYYSFNMKVPEPGPMRAWLRKKRDAYAIRQLGIIGGLLNWIFPDPLLSLYAGLSPETRILDAGCGTGSLLWRLREAGLPNTAGIDPYNTQEIRYGNGLVIAKRQLNEASGEWDLITWHHSFEHIADPLGELRKANELLSDNGKCIVRLPVVDSLAWEQYGTDWVQIDAPRHIFLHSRKSLGIVAEKNGLEITSIDYDSTAFQFWGSEQYVKGIPLTSDRSYLSNHSKSVFTSRDIRSFEKRARELNRTGEGDQAVIFMMKKSYGRK
ncbi:MAG: class I SAM-dependent methyltransferase [Bacteroidales bacterium]|nr:class I SAM-dependent methyltransferase [Bacteroidales bacterium]